MSANTSQVYPAGPKAWPLAIADANTVRAGTGDNVHTLVAAGDNGSRVDRVRVKATGATRQGILRLYVKDGGTEYVLQEIAIAASGPGAAAKSLEFEIVHTTGTTPVPDGLPLVLLAPGQSLDVSSHLNDSFHLIAFGGDY